MTFFLVDGKLMRTASSGLAPGLVRCSADRGGSGENFSPSLKGAPRSVFSYVSLDVIA